MSDDVKQLDFNSMRNTDIKTVDKNTLIDINAIKIDEDKPVEDRLESFIQQVQNPYCFRVGDVAVKVVYKENGPTFQKNFEEMLLSMKI